MLRLPLGPLGPGLGLLSMDQDRSLISALPARRSAPTYQTKQVSKKGVEGRRREARRRPKKLRFIGRNSRALAHPSPSTTP